MKTTHKTWRQKLAAVMEWSPVDKGQIPLVMLLLILGQYLLWGWLALRRPDRDHVVNVAALQHLFAVTWCFVAAGLLLVLLGLLLRRRAPDRLWFQYLSVLFYGSVLIYMGYNVGLNEISTGLVLLGAPVFGFIVLDRRAVWLGTANALALFFAVGIATLHGHLPYAPIIAPTTDATVAQFQFYSVIAFGAPHFLSIILLADQTLHYWRAREENIRQLSRTDALTGVPNRRSIMEQLDREVERARRNRQPLCVVLLDLDHFKRINDTHGHPTGDRVLQEAARVLAATLRTTDSIGRYGGEEFMLLLPGTRADGADVLLERCRAALAATGIRSDAGERLSVTASFGVMSNENHQQQDAATLVKAADEALYRAKAGGRNRVEIAA